MLTITVPETEFYDEDKDEFITLKETKLKLEHSLLSVSKWEAKWHKSYFLPTPKEPAEYLDYIRCMTVNSNEVNPLVYRALTNDNVRMIGDYISDPMTGTTFRDDKKRPNRHVLTSEEIYYSMASYQIPFECDRWHLNRLMVLLRIASIKNEPKKKSKKGDLAKDYARLNDQRTRKK